LNMVRFNTIKYGNKYYKMCIPIWCPHLDMFCWYSYFGGSSTLITVKLGGTLSTQL
jgi:hypothetical protein